MIPGAPSLNGGRAAIPVPIARLIGREHDLDGIVTLLATVRLLTLTGEGGVGKTSLALAAAGTLASSCDRVTWVDLAPLADPTQLSSTVAAALAVKEPPGQQVLVTLRMAIGDRQDLIVLDNAEHLVDSVAQIADALLQGCPRLRFLITSREPLGIIGEATWRVPSLPVPDVTVAATTDTLRSVPSVALFVERARSLVPAFTLTDANASAVGEICRRLDGLPLALELAAARIPVLAPAEIATRLDDRFRLLTLGSRTAAPRQQSLQATLDWSHDLLTAPERVLLRRLAVFGGGWSLDAAQAIGGRGGIDPHVDLDPHDVLDLLTRLVAKSLVQAEQQGATVRFRMLETVRHYALTRLGEAGETLAVQRAHAEWCRALAAEAAPHVRTADESSWLALLDRERDNLRLALGWCHVHDPPVGLELATDLWRFWQVRSSYSTDRRWLELLLAANPEPTARRARALHAAGCLAREQGDLVTARMHLDEALALGRALHESQLVGRVLSDLATVLVRVGDARAARAMHEEALVHLRRSQDAHELGPLLASLGASDLWAGDLPRARALLDEALTVLRTIGDHWRMGFALSMLGRLATLEGRWDDADRLLAEGLAIAEGIGSQGRAALLQWRQGHAALRRGDVPRATELLESALAQERALDDRFASSGILVDLARAQLAAGEEERAEQSLDESLALQEEIAASGWRAVARHTQGLAAWQRGDTARALAKLRAALEEHRALDHRLDVAECLEALGWVLAAERPERSVRLIGAATTARAAIGAPLPPLDQPAHERAVQRARTGLGQQRFAAIWAGGQALSLDEAVAVAMISDDRHGGPERGSGVPPAASPWRPLTGREVEVAMLVAEGLSSRAIGTALAISPSTVERHVENIFSKLGLHSRAQVAAWMVARDPARSQRS